MRKVLVVAGIVLAVLAALVVVSLQIDREGGTVAEAAEAVGEPVTRIIRLETRDIDAYRESLDEGRAIMRDIGVTPEMRVEVVGAGREPGSTEIRLVVEYPDAATRELWATRLDASRPYRAWARTLKPLRTVLSDEEGPTP